MAKSNIITRGYGSFSVSAMLPTRGWGLAQDGDDTSRIPPAISGTEVVNAQATSDVPVNYEICRRSGFRQYPGEIYRDGYGILARKKSIDYEHPQDKLRSGGNDTQKGPQNPEPTDSFISTSISAEDL